MAASTSLIEAATDFAEASPDPARAGRVAGMRRDIRIGARAVWFSFQSTQGAVIALRAAYAGDGLTLISHTQEGRGGSLELVAASARFRIKYEWPSARGRVVHVTTWITPTRELLVPFTPRDLFVFRTQADATETQGVVHTAQRGPRTGIVYATAREPQGATFLYWQNLSALNEFSKLTQTTPAGRVGGEWPELGYSPAPVEHHALPADREVIFSDVFLTLDAELPQTEGDAARIFLDLMADTYCELPRPEPAFHMWPDKAEATVRDLAFSPKCTYRKQGRRFLMPYVGDSKKPPESMVQLTVLMSLLEYEVWTERDFVLTRRLLESLPMFFDKSVGSVVRWLPGETFGNTDETGQKHENMDSWYLYHTLFNLSRLATLGNVQAKAILRKSLAYAVRVAQRFDYRWPVFFHTKTLEVVRGETKPGAGGEHDVAGLYALVMMHAFELFKDEQYLQEAVRAASSLKALGFKLGYQMNTTGFAAEAMLHLYQKTKEPHYLDLMNVCLANIFENMWIWECGFGHAIHYHTFFGLFPLRDAPYLAEYEELEALSKFHDLLKLGGEHIRPSVRMLIAEYAKFALDRVWQYFPASLPVDGLSEKQESGQLDNALAVPVEDLQDGWEQSGKVGQEIYGAGVALVYTTRHFKKLGDSGVLLFCEYPVIDISMQRRRCRFTVGGEERLGCRVRLVPVDPCNIPPQFSVRNGKPLRGTLSSEGHLCYNVRGGERIEIQW